MSLRERRGQEAKDVLDRGFGLVNPIIDQVLRNRDAVDVEDHPAARAILEGRQPGHRVAVLPSGSSLRVRICC